MCSWMYLSKMCIWIISSNIIHFFLIAFLANCKRSYTHNVVIVNKKFMQFAFESKIQMSNGMIISQRCEKNTNFLSGLSNFVPYMCFFTLLIYALKRAQSCLRKRLTIFYAVMVHKPGSFNKELSSYQSTVAG